MLFKIWAVLKVWTGWSQVHVMLFSVRGVMHGKIPFQILFSQRRKHTFSWSVSFVESFRRKSALYDADIKMLNTALTRFSAPSVTTDTPMSSCDLFTRRLIMLEILSVAICCYEKQRSKIRSEQNNFRHSLFQKPGWLWLFNILLWSSPFAHETSMAVSQFYVLLVVWKSY